MKYVIALVCILITGCCLYKTSVSCNYVLKDGSSVGTKVEIVRE